MNAGRDFITTAIFATGLILGYLAAQGTSGREISPVPPATPTNYDPGRAVAADAIKAAIDSQDRCWKAVIQLKGQEAHHE